VDFVIPGNDDALRAIRLFASKIGDAVTAGRGMRESRMAEEDATRAQEAAEADAAARLRTAVRPQRRETPTPTPTTA
jgi:small subunit ribosomal protein S2